MGVGELGGKSYGCMDHRDLGGPESIQPMLKDGIKPDVVAEIVRVGMECDIDFLARVQSCAFITGREPGAKDVMAATLQVEPMYRSVREDPRIIAAQSRFVARDRKERMEAAKAAVPAKEGLRNK